MKQVPCGEQALYSPHYIRRLVDIAAIIAIIAARIMLPINDFEGPLKTFDEIMNDLVWEDYYYCKDCAEETSVEVTGLECEGK